MNDSMPEFDDRLLDRLVDGELSAEERRRLLASLDGQADGWRRCALAFVEAQTWGSAMKRIMHAAPETTANPASVLNATARSWQRAASWLVIAASLAVAFGLGLQYRDVGDLSPSDRDVAVIPPAPPSPEDPDPALAPNANAVTLVVNDARGNPQRVEVPLVEGRDLGAHFAESPAWSNSPELRQRLEAQGIGLEARRRYAPMFFQQQDQLAPMIVPVDDVFVKPVNRPVY